MFGAKPWHCRSFASQSTRHKGWIHAMTKSSVAPITHRGLGAMLRLSIDDGLSFDLTHEEARTLARAMKAVTEGKSKVADIYMSPIACDRDFSAKVTPDGLALEAREPPLHLGWPEVGAIAAALAEQAGPG